MYLNIVHHEGQARFPLGSSGWPGQRLWPVVTPPPGGTVARTVENPAGGGLAQVRTRRLTFSAPQPKCDLGCVESVPHWWWGRLGPGIPVR